MSEKNLFMNVPGSSSSDFCINRSLFQWVCIFLSLWMARWILSTYISFIPLYIPLAQVQSLCIIWAFMGLKTFIFVLRIFFQIIIDLKTFIFLWSSSCFLLQNRSYRDFLLKTLLRPNPQYATLIFCDNICCWILNNKYCHKTYRMNPWRSLSLWIVIFFVPSQLFRFPVLVAYLFLPCSHSWKHLEYRILEGPAHL